MKYEDYKTKAENWDYYQELLKQNGFDGITDLLTKYKQLEQVQQSLPVAVPDLDTAVSIFERAACHSTYKMVDGVKAVIEYALSTPTPSAEQKHNESGFVEMTTEQIAARAGAFAKRFKAGIVEQPDNPRDHTPMDIKFDEQSDSAAVEPHSDDIAVDRFAALMKSKIAAARAKGRGGWDDPEQCPVDYLAELLGGHIMKNNEGNFVDIANLCMMLTLRNANPDSLRLYAIDSWKEMINRALGDESPYTDHKLARITEQDATRIAQSLWSHFGYYVGQKYFDDWLFKSGYDLLSKLNEEDESSTRELDYKAQMDKMVNRFLGWKLPENFYPDCGITFKHIDTWGGYPNNWPIGTNLFTADQARNMFEYVLKVSSND